METEKSGKWKKKEEKQIRKCENEENRLYNEHVRNICTHRHTKGRIMLK